MAAMKRKNTIKSIDGEKKNDVKQEISSMSESSDGSDNDFVDFRKKLLKSSNNTAAKEESVEAKPETEENEGKFESDGKYRNKQRVLIFSSRGVGSRYRHLMEDLRKLIPHHKKEVKLEIGKKESLSAAITQIAELKSCDNTVFFECKKKTDLYMWVSRMPSGPSVKFHVLNVHTMDELKLTGNCMHGSRPILSFSEEFERNLHYKLIAQLFVNVFNTPRGHPKSKPFVDRIMSFYIADKKIWMRNYQIADATDEKVIRKSIEKPEDESLSLVEIGPRFVLNPIRIFAGSFGGPILYQNVHYVSPNAIRAEKKREAGRKIRMRVAAKKHMKEKFENMELHPDPVDEVFR